MLNERDIYVQEKFYLKLLDIRKYYKMENNELKRTIKPRTKTRCNPAKWKSENGVVLTSLKKLP